MNAEQNLGATVAVLLHKKKLFFTIFHNRCPGTVVIVLHQSGALLYPYRQDLMNIDWLNFGVAGFLSINCGGKQILCICFPQQLMLRNPIHLMADELMEKTNWCSAIPSPSGPDESWWIEFWCERISEHQLRRETDPLHLFSSEIDAQKSWSLNGRWIDGRSFVTKSAKTILLSLANQQYERDFPVPWMNLYKFTQHKVNAVKEISSKK